MKTTDFTKFKPRDYLNYYYTHIDEENQGLLEFFADAYKDIPPNAVMLEFGGGPTLYQIISAARFITKIDFSDYLKPNLDEIRAWKAGSSGAFNWEMFIKRALEIEGLASDEDNVKERERLIRSKIDKVMAGDAFNKDPCGPLCREYYDVLGMSFVPEGITDSKEIWKESLNNILSMLKSGGTLITAAILGADYWHSGPQTLPAVNLKEEDFKNTFPELGLTIRSLKTIPSEVPDPLAPTFTGYTGMIFIKAAKA